MPIYRDCSLVELMVVALGTLVFLTLIFSCLSKLLCGYVWPGYILASALFFFVTKLLLSRLQKIKVGKPPGFYQHLIIKKCIERGFIRGKYITRVGRWAVRRFDHA
jgi:conjugative transfer region protein (TIGR03750 family)